MYVIKSHRAYCNLAVSGIGAYDRPLEKAARYATLVDALWAIQIRVLDVSNTLSMTLNIEKLVITPGTTVRKEVPLGTEGSKVALKGVTGEYVILDRVNFGAYHRDLAKADLFPDVASAIFAWGQWIVRASRYADHRVTPVGVLDTTSEEQLSTVAL